MGDAGNRIAHRRGGAGRIIVRRRGARDAEERNGAADLPAQLQPVQPARQRSRPVRVQAKQEDWREIRRAHMHLGGMLTFAGEDNIAKIIVSDPARAREAAARWAAGARLCSEIVEYYAKLGVEVPAALPFSCSIVGQDPTMQFLAFGGTRARTGSFRLRVRARVMFMRGSCPRAGRARRCDAQYLARGGACRGAGGCVHAPAVGRDERR